jgi:hypothetical protein
MPDDHWLADAELIQRFCKQSGLGDRSPET